MDPNWIKPEEQLSIINRMIGKTDTFVCLGDVGDPQYVPMIRARQKILLLGNPNFQIFYYAPTVVFIFGEKDFLWTQVDCGIAVESIPKTGSSSFTE